MLEIRFLQPFGLTALPNKGTNPSKQFLTFACTAIAAGAEKLEKADHWASVAVVHHSLHIRFVRITEFDHKDLYLRIC